MAKKTQRIQELSNGTKKEQYLLDRINGNLKALKFSEEKGIASFQQLDAVIFSLYEKKQICTEQLGMIENTLKEMYALISAVERYHACDVDGEDSKCRFASNMIKEGLYKFLTDKGLINSSEQDRLRAHYSEYSARFQKLVLQLKNVNASLQEYDDFIFNLKRIDDESGHIRSSHLEKYYKLKEEESNIDRRRNEDRRREL